MQNFEQYPGQRRLRNVVAAVALLMGGGAGVGGAELVFPGKIGMACREVRDVIAYAVQGEDYEPTAIHRSEK